MLNIEFQLCGLIVLILLLVRYLYSNGLRTHSRTLFLHMIISSTICVVLDIFWIYAIYLYTYGNLDNFYVSCLCKLYIVALLVNGGLAFGYVYNECFLYKMTLTVRLFYIGVVLIGSIIITLLPIDYYIKDGILHYSTTIIKVAYGILIFIVVSTLYICTIAKSQISQRRRLIIVVWQLSWVILIALQLHIEEMLVLSFGIAFGVLFVYIELESPHEYIDRSTGAFTYNALIHYVSDCFKYKKPFTLLYLKLDFTYLQLDLNIERSVYMNLTNFMKQIKPKHSQVFCQPVDTVALVLHKYEDITDFQNVLRVHLHKLIPSGIKVKQLVVPDSGIFATVDDFINCINFYEHDETHVDDNVILDKDLRDEMYHYFRIKYLIQDAIDNNRVEVYYQPFYEVALKKFTVAEALVRLRDINNDIVPPSNFITIAEKSGLIHLLGQEIFRQVCDLLSKNIVQDLGIKYIEVNLSPAQFNTDSPTNFVKDTMMSYGLSTELINLEITESTTNIERQTMLNNMKLLHNFGMHFSLDDFGTGSSNLEYFIEMPISVVKFDYKFTQGYFKQLKTKLVMESIITLVHRLDLQIVAEGVETESQLETMCDLGVDYIQGYYFSRPLSEEDFIKFLKDNNNMRDS